MMGASDVDDDDDVRNGGNVVVFFSRFDVIVGKTLAFFFFFRRNRLELPSLPAVCRILTLPKILLSQLIIFEVLDGSHQ